jgi:hypothetical protein
MSIGPKKNLPSSKRKRIKAITRELLGVSLERRSNWVWRLKQTPAKYVEDQYPAAIPSLRDSLAPT